MIKKTAKVIGIIDNTTIIIDFGFFDSAEVGQKVRIIAKGDSVYNLDNEEVGTLDLIKDELEITTVYDKFSLCQKITKETKPIYSISQINLSKTVDTIHKLDVDVENIVDLGFPPPSPIQKGDIAEIFIYWHM